MRPAERLLPIYLSEPKADPMLDLNNLTPEQYRERYLALQENARARASTLPDLSTPPMISSDSVIVRETIPPGWYAPIRLRRGEALYIENPEGTPGVSLFMWNADDPSERYNAGDTVKLQWTTLLGGGRVLFSDMGRVLVAIIADSGAGCDPILGPSTPATAGGARNGRDNLRNAAAKFGLSRRDVGPSLTLFAPMRVDTEGRPHLASSPPREAFVALRAEMNLFVAISNTPHPLADPVATGPILLTRFPAPEADIDDPCRTLTEEAARGYENTDLLFA